MSKFFVFDESSADRGDSNGFVDKGGHYANFTLKDCFVSKNKNGTSVLTLNGTLNGTPIYFLDIYYKNKEGKELMGFHKINAMIGLLGIQGMTYAQRQVTIGKKHNRQILCPRT